MEQLKARIARKRIKYNPTDVIKTIYARRSVRRYKDEPLDVKTIERLIDAGRMAPSAMNKQLWKFYVLTQKEDIQLFSKEISRAVFREVLRSSVKKIIKTTKDILHYPHNAIIGDGADHIFHGAPVVVFITGPKEEEWISLDIGMCSQNIMLAAHSIGIASCPIGLAKHVHETKSFSKLLIPESEEVFLAITLGYANELPKVKERTKNNLVYIENINE